MAKKFFYVCAGIFLLALSYHFGAGTAAAQYPSNPIVAYSGDKVICQNGDVYVDTRAQSMPWQYLTNVFAPGGHTEVRQSTFGQVKVGNR